MFLLKFAEQQLHGTTTQAEILSFPRRDEMTLLAHAGIQKRYFKRRNRENSRLLG